jgi:hypothetical protein
VVSVQTAPTRAFLIVIAGLLAVSVALQVTRDRGWTAYEPETPVMWVQSPSAVRSASLGFESIVSDLYWMRAVVYFGKQSLSKDPRKRYDLLYPLLDLVTTLDPRFNVAYRFGAIFLSEPQPAGPGRPDQAIALLEKGFTLAPHRWEYLHDIGFIYYWHLREYDRGAAYLERAAEVPGAPFWLRSSAATMHADQGNRASARLLWRQIHDGAENDTVRNIATIRLQQLDAMDGIDQLTALVQRFEQVTGRAASDWRELVAARLMRGIPLDPTGTPFAIDPATRTVRVSEQSTLWPMPAPFGAGLPR